MCVMISTKAHVAETLTNEKQYWEYIWASVHSQFLFPYLLHQA